MTDIKTPEERSKNMAAISSKNTKPEIYLRKLLFSQGYRYRKNYSKITGHPDIYLPKYRTAVFVHGCFWHRHSGCKYAYMPKSNVEFWKKKFLDNQKRDEKEKRELEEQKIKCLIIWECTIKKMRKDSETEKEVLKQIEDFLLKKELYKEIAVNDERR